ncbi:MAG: queuosine precursor transporter [Bryobacterales bacterium]|nr:queuosine precursor transporter [Bryobacterales bacterium]MDE0628766.1 queuosine precursor transporter [Bryobacterales bacterium]
MTRYDWLFLVLAGLFVASLVLANAMVFKFVDVPLPFIGLATISIGVLPYPITFLCTDLISELYGKKRADAIVLTGFVVSVYMLGLLQLGRILPVSHLQDEMIQEHYMAVFGQSGRAIVGSMAAYLLAQFIDVRLYHFWRRLTNGRHLWLRNNASTMMSQLLDTTVVVTILFAGVWTWSQIGAVILASYAYKLLVAAADTPLLYLGSSVFRSVKDESRRRGLIHEAA